MKFLANVVTRPFFYWLFRLCTGWVKIKDREGL
jgi:hypothetical protein